MDFNDKMEDKEKELQGLKRAPRNKWGEQHQALIEELCPTFVTYDVNATQGLDWCEYAYTECIGGLYLTTQNIETNARIMQLASEEHSNIDIHEKLLDLCNDKYMLDDNDLNDTKIPDVCFMPGGNLLDLISREIVSRYILENENFMVKLHPVSEEHVINDMTKILGRTRVIRKEYSGVTLLKNCETAYVQSATELTIMAVILGKKIVNVSNFLNESAGAYYAITRVLFNSKNPLQTLMNLINCEYSGIIMPYMSDTEVKNRIEKYYAKTQELSRLLKPLTREPDMYKKNKKGCGQK